MDHQTLYLNHTNELQKGEEKKDQHIFCKCYLIKCGHFILVTQIMKNFLGMIRNENMFYQFITTIKKN